MLDPRTPLAELKRLRTQWSQELDRINKLLKADPLTQQHYRVQQDHDIILQNVLALNLQIQNHANR